MPIAATSAAAKIENRRCCGQRYQSAVISATIVALWPEGNDQWSGRQLSQEKSYISDRKNSFGRERPKMIFSTSVVIPEADIERKRKAGTADSARIGTANGRRRGNRLHQWSSAVAP